VRDRDGGAALPLFGLRRFAVDLSIVVGNPKPRSRTLVVAAALADRLCAVTGATLARTVDLCDYASDLFKWPHEELEALNEAVAASDCVVFASPTYKAAYTGLLKAFLDRYPNNGLAGVTAIPVMTGGSPIHAMAVDTTLRAVLIELGASLPTRGLFFLMTQMGELDAVVEEWADQNLKARALLGPMTRGAVR
jgi:FMN reductase